MKHYPAIAYVIVLLSIRGNFCHPTQTEKQGEQEIELLSIDGVRCSSGFTMSSNGECEKIETIKVEGETLDLCELFGINCEEQSSTSETILAPDEEIFEIDFLEKESGTLKPYDDEEIDYTDYQEF